MPNADVIEELREKKGGWPLLSSCKEKTLLNRLYVAYVNSTRCAHHMCTAYFSKSLYLSLFVFCHGKWVVVGQRFAQCWKGHNDVFTLCSLLLLWNHSFQILIKAYSFVINLKYIFLKHWNLLSKTPIFNLWTSHHHCFPKCNIMFSHLNFQMNLSDTRSFGVTVSGCVFFSKHFNHSNLRFH